MYAARVSSTLFHLTSDYRVEPIKKLSPVNKDAETTPDVYFPYTLQPNVRMSNLSAAGNRLKQF